MLSGSLPPGVPDDWYADVVAHLQPYDCKVAVDTSDAPLAALAAAFGTAAPDVIKPNSEELASLTGVDAQALEDALAQGDPDPVVAAAQQLIDRGAKTVLATLGAAGALLVNDTGSWLATPPPITPRSTVGAGDFLPRGLRARRRRWCRGTPAASDGRRLRQRRCGTSRFGTAVARPRSTSTRWPSPRSRPTPRVPRHRKATMTNSTIISTELVLLDVDAGSTKESVIGRLATRLAESGRVNDGAALQAAAMAREAQSATGLPGGIAIPHCRSTAVTSPSIGFARLAPKVDFGAPHGPADLVFLIAAPDGAGAEHMKLLSSLARALVRPRLRAVAARREVGRGRRGPGRRRGQPRQRQACCRAGRHSTCRASQVDHRHHRMPDRNRHTYMAADALKLAAERAGVNLTVETQGSGQHPGECPDHQRR